MARALETLIFAIAVGLPHLAAVPQADPGRPIDPAWKVQSFVPLAGLEDAALMQVACGADGTVWIAASDGLYRSHGYIWRRFSTDDGLPSDYVRCVTVTRRGAVWVGTDRGVARLVGERFVAAAVGELAGNSVRRIVEESDGRMWFCCDRWPDATRPGGLTRLTNGRGQSFGLADGLPTDYVSDVFVDSRGRVFVLTRRGLAEFDGQRFRQPLVEAAIEGADDYVWSLVELADRSLLAATTNSFFACRAGVWQRVGPRLPGLRNPALLGTRDGVALACTPEDEPRFLQWDGATFAPVTEAFPFRAGDVQDLAEAPDGAIWAAGRSFLVRWERRPGQWRVHSDLPMPRLRDRSGAIWFGDERSVVRRHGNQVERFDGVGSLLLADADGGVWWQAGSTLRRWNDSEGVRIVSGAEVGLAHPRPAFVDGAGSVWARSAAASDRARVARRSSDGWQTFDLDDGSGWTVRLASPDPMRGSWWVVRRESPTSNRLVYVTDGSRREVPLPAIAAPLHEPRICVSRDGVVWVFGLFGLYRSTDRGRGAWQSVQLPGRHVFAARDRDDGLWFAYLGTTGGVEGVSRWHDGAWTHVRAEVDGTDPFGEVELVFPTRRGTLGILAGSPRRARLLTLPFDTNVVTAVTGSQGHYWLGTAAGVLEFAPDGAPPDTIVQRAPDGITLGERLIFDVTGMERFSAGSDRRLRVQISVDGGPWRQVGLAGRPVELTGLGVGEHHVRVRAVDEGGDVDPTPATVTCRVTPPPLQSRPWFWPTMVGLFAAILALAAYGLVARRKLGGHARALEHAVRERTAALRSSEEKYRALFEQSRDAIFLLHLDSRIADGNPAACALTGMSRAELRERSLDELFDRPLALPPADGSVTPLARVVPERATRRNGRQHVLIGADLRCDEDGVARGYLVIGRDVTARVALDERLRHAQKMEAIGRMAGAIAHDFNNMLTAILGFSDLVAQRVAGDDELASDVGNIVESALRAKELTGQIRSFSRGEAASPRSVGLDEMITGMEDLIRSLLRDSVRLELRLGAGSDGGCIHIDPGRLEQVILNLCVNANDAMPDGGDLIIESSRDPMGQVALTIADTGEGMPGEVADRIFEPFFTTKPIGGGSGLGLAIAYGIVDQSGGAIAVDSEVGRGTRFRVQWPSCEPAVVLPTPTRDEPPAEPTATNACSESILLVEDDASVRDTVARCLERAGYRVFLAGDGQEALDLLDGGSVPADLVISDVRMPRMGGAELVRELRRRSTGARILLISGYAELDDRDSESVDVPVLAKPFRPPALLARVREILDGSRSSRA